MTILLAAFPDFDIRACPIWAIPQLAELKRRLSWSGTRAAKFLEFIVVHPEDGYQIGRFTIDVEDEGALFGYISSKDMNDYRHPALNSW